MVVTVGAADTVVTAAAGELAYREGAYFSGREGELLLPGLIEKTR